MKSARVERGAILSRIVVAGSLDARRKSQIGARVPGRIKKLLVNVGDRVATGDVLFEIDSRTFASALRQVEAGRDLARAERRQLEEDLARQQELFARALVAEQVLARLRTRVEVARARERQAAQAVEIARQDLEDTKVRAPYGGSIARREADEGTAVTPQTTVLAGGARGDRGIESGLGTGGRSDRHPRTGPTRSHRRSGHRRLRHHRSRHPHLPRARRRAQPRS